MSSSGDEAATKREVLRHLPTVELMAAVGRLGVVVSDLGNRNQLVEALVTSAEFSLTDVLNGYKRERLKELCRARGLDDSGKEKSQLVERLLGPAPAGMQLGLLTPPLPEATGT